MIEMNARKRWILIIGGAALLIAGLLVAGLSTLGFLPWQRGNLYKDPQGRFSMEVDPSWEQVETDGSYALFILPNPPMNMYLLALDAGTVEDAFSQTMETVGFDTGLLSGGNVTTFGNWQAYSQKDRAGLMYGLAGQTVGEKAFVMMVKANQPNVDPENASIIRALMSVKITGQDEAAIKSYSDLEALVRNEVDRLAGSISVAVVHKDKIVYTYAYGEANPAAGTPANTQTIYAFGSMSKVFTATALMQLVEQGKVDLDAWPGNYVPEFPKTWNVTVRQLLTHSACLPSSDQMTDGLIVYQPGEKFASLEEIFSGYVKEFPDLTCEPGKASIYSNPPFLALARIIEEVSGEPYETYVIDHLLIPLDMQSTRFELVEAEERYAKDQYPTNQVDQFIARMNEYRGPGQEGLVLQRGERYSTLEDYRIFPPWGGLRGTPSDVTHFLQMHFNGGRYGDNQILKPETVAAMQENQPAKDGSPLGFGLSWWLGKDQFGDYYYHSGGGAAFENQMRFYPNLDLGVVVTANIVGYQRDKLVEGLVSAWTHEK
jgi:CubicO group peptidase (beta-lactamase class C family)